MSCCGQHRETLRAASIGLAAPPDAPPPAIRYATPVTFTGDSPIVVRGTRTGLTYLFGPRGQVLEIDGRDVSALVATGRFERAPRHAGG